MEHTPPQQQVIWKTRKRSIVTPKTKRKLVIGPPGTGKTFFVIQQLMALIAAGAPIAIIALVSFTRAAIQEIIARIESELGRPVSVLPWARTIHSLAYKLLDVKRSQMMTPYHWKAFARQHGYLLSPVANFRSDDKPPGFPSQCRHDKLRFVCELARNSRVDLATAASRFGGHVSLSELRLFTKRYNAFKESRGLLDFTDLLEACLAKKLYPLVRHAFVDEGQDLTPLQAELVEMWFSDCETLTLCGDDDQSIYVWSGADPGLLSAYKSSADETTVLDLSYRIPCKVHTLAESVIGEVTNRISKAYMPRLDPGEVIRMTNTDALKEVCSTPESVMVLVRNREFLPWWISELGRADALFIVEGQKDANPFCDESVRTAVIAAANLQAGGDISFASLETMVAFVPSNGPEGLLPRGMKTELKRRDDLPTTRISRDGLASRFMMGRFLTHLDAAGPVAVLSKLAPEHAQFFEKLYTTHGTIPSPRITLSTIHASKGREADVIVIEPDMSAATYREFLGSATGRENEHRVQYVGVTRARKKLILVEPTTARYFDYLYHLKKTGLV